MIGTGALTMGARYRISHVSEVRTIKWVQDMNDGSFYFLHLDGTDSRVYASGVTQVYLVSLAPRCACGRHFERCENECEWPAWLEDVFMGRDKAGA
jgi:hypothetical protein